MVRDVNRIEVLTVDTPSLGDRSYVVHDGHVAFVVDPQRDIDRVLDLLERNGVEATDVFETHVHNDYLTGGPGAGRGHGCGLPRERGRRRRLRALPDP